MKPVLLGEAPSERGDEFWERPLFGRPAVILCRLAQIVVPGGSDDEDYYDALCEFFTCVNAIERYTDAYPWSKEAARARWSAWVQANVALAEVVTVVCLGRLAATAVYLDRSTAWGEWFATSTTSAVVIPHPSGLNRAYNNPATRGVAGRVLREAIADECRAD